MAQQRLEVAKKNLNGFQGPTFHLEKTAGNGIRVNLVAFISKNLSYNLHISPALKLLKFIIGEFKYADKGI